MRFKQLRRVFGSDAASTLHARIARLFVLYEDLRIEILGIVEKDIGRLDANDDRYRINYFLRRSISTWWEYAEAIRLLDQDPEFPAIKQRFSTGEQKKWDRAARFFRKHEYFMKNIRNDIGGHFGSQAAEYAVSNFEADAIGKFELVRLNSSHSEMRPLFAGEIAATALHRSLSQANARDRYKRMFRLIKAGWKHGAYSTQQIAVFYLWDRFGA